MKIIVSHFNPDLDSAFAIWLVRRFLPGWKKAELKFVPAGETWENKPPDDNSEILHLDTGLGRFDHHQSDEDTCASILIWEEILLQSEKIKDWQKKAVERILKIVNEVDHARFLAWPEPESDNWDFHLYQILGGLVGNFKDRPEKAIEMTLPVIDGLFRVFGEKVEAEEVIKNGLEFKTKWGKGIGFMTENAEVQYLALKKGFSLVVKKRPKSGHLGLYGSWQKGVDLEQVFEKLTKKDPKADWFLHASGCLVLNGSRSNSKMKPTNLDLETVIKLLPKR